MAVINNGTIAAICVTIFGFLLVIAAVWLFYQYRLTQLSEGSVASSEPPMRKLIVHRGRVVPASKLATPSIRSGWSSMKHRSWLLSTSSFRRHDDLPSDYPPVPQMQQRSPRDLEAGQWRKQKSFANMRTVLESPTASFEQSRTDPPTVITAPSQASLGPSKSAITQFWSRGYPKSASTLEKNSAARTFLDDASYDESLPNFPRPPYLNPLQSRYNIR